MKPAAEKISISLEFETVSKLLARLAKHRNRFPTKSHIIRHAVHEFLNPDKNEGDAS
ncbi:hypothetical protein J4227_01380 [Candidatus Woesearchaeota archaeon]|nr:hypothetical protein [Candidatus Woesearchaeota archaeon]